MDGIEDYITTCPICKGGVKTAFSLDFEDITGMSHDYTQKEGICPKCGLIFTQNPFSAHKLANRYKSESKYEYDENITVPDEKSEVAIRSRRIRSFIADSVGEITNGVLEVGAASGQNLSLYKSCGPCYGVEPSALNCTNAKKFYDVDMFCGTFSEFDSSNHDRKYELIYLSMILEHIVNPFEFICRLKKYNTEYMFIEVPTIDIKNTDEPFGMFCEEHVNIFTLESLNNLMNVAGYGLVNARLELMFLNGNTEPYPAGWPAIDSVWKLGGKSLNYVPTYDTAFLFDKYISENKKELLKVASNIDKIPDDVRIAVYGTGHHTSMLLKNTSLGKKNIIKFYDSDSRKYKYTMHDREITAFSVEDLDANDIQGIVIGSYIFEKSISDIIRQVSDIRIYRIYDNR